MSSESLPRSITLLQCHR